MPAPGSWSRQRPPARPAGRTTTRRSDTGSARCRSSVPRSGVTIAPTRRLPEILGGPTSVVAPRTPPPPGVPPPGAPHHRATRVDGPVGERRGRPAHHPQHDGQSGVGIGHLVGGVVFPVVSQVRAESLQRSHSLVEVQDPGTRSPRSPVSCRPSLRGAGDGAGAGPVAPERTAGPTARRWRVVGGGAAAPGAGAMAAASRPEHERAAYGSEEHGHDDAETPVVGAVAPPPNVVCTRCPRRWTTAACTSWASAGRA